MSVNVYSVLEFQWEPWISNIFDNGKLENKWFCKLSVWLPLPHSRQMWLCHKTFSVILLNKVITGDHFH